MHARAFGTCTAFSEELCFSNVIWLWNKFDFAYHHHSN